jgi:hypothetical protein
MYKMFFISVRERTPQEMHYVWKKLEMSKTMIKDDF